MKNKRTICDKNIFERGAVLESKKILTRDLEIGFKKIFEEQKKKRLKKKAK